MHKNPQLLEQKTLRRLDRQKVIPSPQSICCNISTGFYCELGQCFQAADVSKIM